MTDLKVSAASASAAAALSLASCFTSTPVARVSMQPLENVVRLRVSSAASATTLIIDPVLTTHHQGRTAAGESDFGELTAADLEMMRIGLTAYAPEEDFSALYLDDE